MQKKKKNFILAQSLGAEHTDFYSFAAQRCHSSERGHWSSMLVYFHLVYTGAGKKSSVSFPHSLTKTYLSPLGRMALENAKQATQMSSHHLLQPP